MADQTQMKRNPVDTGSHNGQHSDHRSGSGSIAGVLHDITELAELQVRLLVADVRAALRHSTWPLVLIVVAACVLLGAVPVLLLGLANLLEEHTELTGSAAILTCGLAASGLGLLVLVLAVWRLRRSLQYLSRSSQELSENLVCVKHVLRPGRESRHA